MKKIVLIVIVFITIISCSNKYGLLESKLKKEIEENVVPNLDDPKSYELVSIETIDTSMYHENIKEMKLFYEDDIKNQNKALEEHLKDTAYRSVFIKRIRDVISDNEKEIKKSDSLLALPDRIMNINFVVKMRAKNKLNALVLETLKYIYVPSEDKFTLSK